MVLRDHICLLTLVLQLTTTWGSKQGSLTFVIDGTGSMKNDISYVIDAVNQITDEVTKTSSQIENIVLVAFNDYNSKYKVPDAQLMIQTTDKNRLRTALTNVLVKDSGGDCPEMAMTGIKLALENSHRNSYLFVFTDAPAKDFHLTKEVIKIAQEKESKVVFVVTPGCEDNLIYKSYENVAVATFGQIFQLKSKSYVKKILDYVKVTSSGDLSTVTGQIVQPSHIFKAIPFTVDHSTRYVIISATGQRHVFVKGLEELPGTTESVIMLSNIKVLKVTNLPPGNYKVMVKGNSLTTVMVYGRTDFTFQYGFSSNERTSIQNSYKQPIQGSKRHLLISINDPDRSVKIASAEILDMEQKVMKVLPLTKKGNNLYTTEMFTSPSSTFLVAVSGSEIKTGEPIRRIAKTPITPLIPTSKPVITIVGKPCCYQYNSDISLTCKVEAFPEPKILWKDGEGKRVHNMKFEKISSTEYQSKMVSKVLKSQTFSCHAVNEAGDVTSTIDVKVYPPFTVPDKFEVMNVKYGREVNLLCNIKSSFSIKIMWIRKIGDKQETIRTSDNIVISSDKTTLTIKNMTLGDQGKYICKVSLVEDEHVEAQRHIEVKINDVEPPKFEKENSVVTVKLEAPITIECKLVKGYPKPKIVWQFRRKGSNFVQSLAESGERLVVKNSSFNDAGNYVCIAENIIGQDKRVVEAIVEAPPKIIVDNDDALYTAVKGDIVLRIPCKVTGFPKPTIVWKVNGTEPIREKHSVEDGTLVIEKPLGKNTGSYTCLAENKLGTDVKTFEADVTDTIEYEQDYGNYSYVYLLEGETKPLICPPAKSPNNYIINWFQESEPLIYNHTNWMITKANITADGNYTCRASNHLGTISHTLIVDIGYRPTFVSEYHQPLVDWDGENQLLDCDIRAKPDVDVSWIYNGKVIKPKIYYLPVRDWGWGDYTCQASNVHGTVNRSFKVISSGCLIKKHSKIGQTPLLLTNDLEPTWPKLKTKMQYFYLKQHDQYLLSCNTKSKSPNVFKNIAKTSAVVATCDHEDKFKVNGKILKFEDLQCESRVEPTIKATGEECLGQNTELFKVGFEANFFVEVYEVCFDKVNKVPLYTKMVISKEISSTSVEESEWYNYTEFGKDEGQYNCTGVSTCCLTKGQLVNGHDVMYGPAHTATFVDNLNSVPLWRSCATDRTKSWGTVEDIFRGRMRFASNFTLWTGASNYRSNNGLMVPRYLWKVAKFPDEDQVAIIHVNDPSPVAEDVRCESKGACRNIHWFKAAKYTYCCPFDEFLKAFDTHNFIM